jgi:hypothetical protein
MFNGESKRQKQISLGGRGGRSKNRDSKQLLAEAAAKREARETTR